MNLLAKSQKHKEVTPTKLQRNTMYSLFSSITYISFSNNIQKFYFFYLTQMFYMLISLRILQTKLLIILKDLVMEFL